MNIINPRGTDSKRVKSWMKRYARLSWKRPANEKEGNLQRCR